MENTSPKPKGGYLRHVRNVFIAGTLSAIPLVGTYFVFRFLFQTLDGILQPAIIWLIQKIFPHSGVTKLPGVGLVALIILVYLLGLLATNMIGRRFIHWLDGVIARTPVVKYVYSAAREAVDSIRRLQSVPFKKVVVVEFPKAGMYSLGFITGKAVDFKGQNKIPVFIPHTPNPMTGFLVLLSVEDIVDTDISVEAAMKMILSGGLVTPDSVGAKS
jgi:uncharacterized membrane protein